jgi:predicted RNA-binding protein YlxR (DUF448 family)
MEEAGKGRSYYLMESCKERHRMKSKKAFLSGFGKRMGLLIFLGGATEGRGEEIKD